MPIRGSCHGADRRLAAASRVEDIARDDAASMSDMPSALHAPQGA